jgi:hypothetical protein
MVNSDLSFKHISDEALQFMFSGNWKLGHVVPQITIMQQQSAAANVQQISFDKQQLH